MFTMKVRRIKPEAVLPRYAHHDDVGLDLVCVEGGELLPGEGRDFDCGLAVEPPPGSWVLIHGRSSAMRKRDLFILSGIIDPGYRGTLMVWARYDGGGVLGRLLAALPLLRRFAPRARIEPGDCLAQAIVLPSVHVAIEEASDLMETSRGAAGFGSTGLRRAI